jgi:hypothetical protein
MLAACVVMAANCADALSGNNIAAAAISSGHSGRIHQRRGLEAVLGRLSADANIGMIRVIAKSRAIRAREQDTPIALAVDLGGLLLIDCSGLA